jgi:hypothetical protein
MEKTKELVNTVEQALKEGKVTKVEQAIQQLFALTEQSEETQKNYSQIVVKTLESFEEKLDINRIKEMVDNLGTIAAKNPSDNTILQNYAKALRLSLRFYSTMGQPNKMERLIATLEKLAENNPKQIPIQEELSLASYMITHYWRERGDYSKVRNRTKKIRGLAKKYPDNQQIKLQLSKSLVLEIDSSNKRNVENVEKLLNEVQTLSKSMPTDKELQLEQVNAYITAMERIYEKPEDSRRWLESIKSIVAANQGENFELGLAKGYLKTIEVMAINNEQSLVKHLDELQLLAEEAQDNQELQAIYAQSLLTTLQFIGIEDMQQTKEYLEELEALADKYGKNEVIVRIYVNSLLGIISLLAQKKQGQEIVPLLDHLKKLDEQYPEDEYIQESFDKITQLLTYIGFKKKEKSPKRFDFI